VGARPGEKFHEELFNSYERAQPTPAQKILRAARERLDPDWVERVFADINLLVLEGDAATLADRIARLAQSRAALVEAAHAAPEDWALGGRLRDAT
jgi:FlaA1/EpsC-like NDP-sugar epimerase